MRMPMAAGHFLAQHAGKMGSAAIIALTQAACVRRRGSLHVEDNKPIRAGIGEGQRGRLGQAGAD